MAHMVVGLLAPGVNLQRAPGAPDGLVVLPASLAIGAHPVQRVS
jgi:hypothetical protein